MPCNRAYAAFIDGKASILWLHVFDPPVRIVSTCVCVYDMFLSMATWAQAGVSGSGGKRRRIMLSRIRVVLIGSGKR